MSAQISTRRYNTRLDAESGEGRVGAAAEPRRTRKGDIEGVGSHLLEVSAIPATALYQARNAAMSPNQPPALMMGTLGAPSLVCRLPIASNRKARSSVKKSKKKATVDLRVQMSRMKVKMNQP